MAKSYLIIICLILNFKAGFQQKNNTKCQTNLMHLKVNLEETEVTCTSCRFTKISQNSEFPKYKLYNPQYANDDKDAFGILMKILQENLSFEKIKSMENPLKVNTLLLFGYSENVFHTGDFCLGNCPPVLIISHTINCQLTAVYNSNILSIIFLRAEYPHTEEVLSGFKRSLQGLHLHKVLIVKETLLRGQDEDAVEILKWFHLNYFWQSMLVDLAGNTLTLDHFTGVFSSNLTIEEFLGHSIKWPDLYGFPINCFIASNPPRSFAQYDSRHKVILKGYYGTIIDLFIRHYNASLQPSMLAELHHYNELDCLKYLKTNQVDICGDVLPLNADYVVTYPDELVRSFLIVPYGKPLPRFYYFLKPFQLNVWSVVAFSFFYKIIMLSVIHRLQQGSWNASLQLLYATLSVLNLPFSLNHIKGSYRRTLEILMTFVGFVITYWYLSVLSSLLFSRLYSGNILSLQNLVDHNISILVDEFEQFVLNASETDPIIMQQLQVVSHDTLQQHYRNLDPQYAYFAQYDLVDYYFHQQQFLLRPRLKVLTGIPSVNEVLAGIPMHPSWPFQHLLNDFMRRILDSGLYQHIYRRVMEEGIQSGYLRYFPTEHHSVEPLSMEYFQLPAALLAVGYSLALLAFLFELYFYERD